MPNPTTVKPSNLLLTRVRIVGEYQLFGMKGDGNIIPGDEYVSALLASSKTKGHLEDFKIVAVYPGISGLQLIDFTVDLLMDDDVNREEARAWGKNFLEMRVFGEKDVAVRWATFLDKDTP